MNKIMDMAAWRLQSVVYYCRLCGQELKPEATYKRCPNSEEGGHCIEERPATTEPQVT
jgi:hypothetical protein